MRRKEMSIPKLRPRFRSVTAPRVFAAKMIALDVPRVTQLLDSGVSLSASP